MASSLNINDLLSQVERLDKNDQLTLLQRLAVLLKKPEKPTTELVRLTSLTGLGSGVWKGQNDIDKYIDEERQW